MVSRRRFLQVILPGMVLTSAGLVYSGYRWGSCPLSDEGYCVGPCSAFIDFDGDKLCDRLPDPEPAALVSEDVAEPTRSATPTATPTTQLPKSSVPTNTPVKPTAMPTRTPMPAKAKPAVACPFGLVNDPYPGRCRRYVDKNRNGICDLSEPSL